MYIYRVRQIPFFLENALTKNAEYFRKFLFLFESTILPRLIMENNFIQITASMQWPTRSVQFLSTLSMINKRIYILDNNG